MFIDERAIRVILPENTNDYFDDIFCFCQEASTQTSLQQTEKNMSSENWETNEESLLYRIFIGNRFDENNGVLTLVYYKDKLIAVSGVERHNSLVAVMAKRYFVLKKYRPYHFFHNFMFCPQFDWIEKQGFKVALITVNEYQEKTVLNLFRRSQNNRALLLGLSSNLPNYSLFKVHPSPINFLSCRQYILYRMLDENFEWNPDIL